MRANMTTYKLPRKHAQRIAQLYCSLEVAEDMARKAREKYGASNSEAKRQDYATRIRTWQQSAENAAALLFNEYGIIAVGYSFVANAIKDAKAAA